MEGGATNLLTRSQSLDSAPWSLGNLSATQADRTLAPDGTVTADKIVEDTSNMFHSLYRDVNVTPGSRQTFSVFVKMPDTEARPFVRLSLQSTDFNNGIDVVCDLSSGAVSGVTSWGTGSGARGAARAVGQGWYRCVLSGVSSTTFAVMRVSVQLARTNLASNYVGDGVSGVFAWGAQLEAGPLATSYVPTTTAIASRSADVVKAASADWFEPSQGSLFAAFARPSWTGTSDGLRSVYDVRGASSAVSLGLSANDEIAPRIESGGSVQWLAPSSASSGALQKTLLTFQPGSSRLVVNGSVTPGPAGPPGPIAPTEVFIGTGSGGAALSGHVRSLIYWSSPLETDVGVDLTR